MKKNNEKGFSLVELLVVVIIIAIVAAIAIPNLLASRRAANEASAISSLRTINSANTAYFSLQTPNAYGTLTTLSGATVGLLDPTFTGASFTKSGYTIAESISGGTPAGQSFCASAVPTSSSTGSNGYATDQNGVIYRYTTPANASAACSVGVLVPGAGVPIG